MTSSTKSSRKTTKNKQTIKGTSTRKARQPSPTERVKPASVQGNLRNLPAALKPLTLIMVPHWVIWRWEWRINEKTGVGSWTKPPFQPGAPKRNAMMNDSRTWGTYQQAITAFEAGECDGIGFCLPDSNVAAFDLDNCRDPETGAIAPEAMAYVDRARSYTETSVSGTGLHVIGLGSGGKEHRKQKLGGDVEIESYRKAERYIVITGLPLHKPPLRLENIDAVIDEVVAELGANNRASHGDFDQWIKEHGDDYNDDDKDIDPDDRMLPRALKDVIEDIPGAGDLSDAFHHAVCWLHEEKWSARKIVNYIDGQPVMPVRYRKRLLKEVYRCLSKATPHKDYEKAQDTSPQRDAAQDNKKAKQDSKAKAKTQAKTDKAVALDFFEDFDKAVAKRPIIKGVLYRGERSNWVGPPGSGKSALLASVAIHVTDESSDWRGYRVKAKVGVVYFAFERKDLVKRRMYAHKPPEVLFTDSALSAQMTTPHKLPIAVAGRAVDLLDKSCIEIIVDTVRAAEAHFGCAVGLVIIDTFNKGIATGGGDEDKAKDQNIAAANLQVVQDELPDIHVALLSHTGKDESRGARGSNARLGDDDMQVQISINGNVRTATTTKANDAATGVLTRFETMLVTLGTDEDGDEITTAIVSDDVPEEAFTIGLSKSQARAIELLERALDEEGKAATDRRCPAGVTVVTVETWRKYCYSGGLSPTGTDSAKRQAFNRATKELLALRRIEIWNELVWLVPGADDGDPFNAKL
jgi:hypothetical protein